MKGAIEWFTRNSVAANILMVTIVFGGIVAFSKVRVEFFPEFSIDTVIVRVPYLGATPSEVERGVTIKVEEAVQDLEGIEKITSIAAEGIGTVTIEVENSYDPRELANDIKNRVDSINTFPAETERPIVSVPSVKDRAITVMIAGDMTERDLREFGEAIRDEIINLPEVTQASLSAIRPYEISIELSEETLEQYDLTLQQVAAQIANSSLDLPAGGVETRGGEVLLRTVGQAYVGRDYEDIPIKTSLDGTRLTLGEIATIRDGFEEDVLYSMFDGKRAVAVDVGRVGDENIIEVVNAVKAYVAERQERNPPGVIMATWQDASAVVKSRLTTLVNSAIFGGILVLSLLMLTLRPVLAFWVCVGIPVSFFGAFALMPHIGVSVNIISLFAFILVLGIVVDDAIVTGENVFTRMKNGEDSFTAALEGTKEVAVPVTFGVLTTMIAFIPLGLLPGTRGELFGQIAVIVVIVLFFSLVESKFILPAHLKHCKVKPGSETGGFLGKIQRGISDSLEAAIETFYQPFLRVALKHRYIVGATFVAMFILSIGMVAGGRLAFNAFPRVAAERLTVRLEMPLGTPVAVTERHVKHIYAMAEQVRQNHEDRVGEDAIQHMSFSVGGAPFSGGFSSSTGPTSGVSNIGEVVMELKKPEQREKPFDVFAVSNEWRDLVGGIPGANELAFRAEIGRGGDPINLQVTGSSFEDLEEISSRVKAYLSDFSGLFDITDNFRDGKEELELKLKPEAEVLGLTQADLANQVRASFFGAEAERIQRGRDDIRVMVRYPESDRTTLDTLETMKVRTATGAEVPFTTVAEVIPGRSFSTINRVDRNRAINITSDADKKSADLGGIRTQLIEDFMPEIEREFPGITYGFEGEGKEVAETSGGLKRGLVIVLCAIYAMLAVAFRSYIQPFIVMGVIPFGIVGAILGHMLLGLDLSMLSFFGMLALIGVVVNDSLVLVDYVNRRREEGMPLFEAVSYSGVRRFRPIMLTSITTFSGLLPLLWEKSTQAQFLKPMAVSLGFGVLFATLITLVLVPASYLIIEDIVRSLKRFAAWFVAPFREQGENTEADTGAASSGTPPSGPEPAGQA